MALNERVRVARRFLRSIRIDADLDNAVALEGFVCPQSSTDILMTMARCVSETGQGVHMDRAVREWEVKPCCRA